MKVTKKKENNNNVLSQLLSKGNKVQSSSIIGKFFKTSKNYHQKNIDGEDLPTNVEKLDKKLLVVGILIGNVLFFFLNYMLNSLTSVLRSISESETGLFGADLDLSFRINYIYESQIQISQFLSLYFVAIVLTTMLIYSKIKRNSIDKIVYGQKGDSRLTTIEEIKNQYPEIPESKEFYDGIGGVPMSHYKDKYYVDTDTVNTVVLGASRSGKGETFVIPLIDNLSRAKTQSNMVVNDPKGELFSSSKQTLEERGYRVLVLNIDDPLQSMSFNPLQLVIDSWANQDYHEASKRANTLTSMLFASGMGSANEFFYKSAKSAVNAIILTIVEDCFKNNCIEKITMYNVAQMLNELGSLFYVDPSNPTKEVSALDEYFNNLPQGNSAKIQYGSTSFAGDKAKGSILSTASQGIEMFTSDLFGKLTSKMSIDLKEIGFPKSIQFRLEESLTGERVTISFSRKINNKISLIKDYRVKVKALGLCVLNFDEDLQDDDILEIFYDGSSVAHARYSITLPDSKSETFDSSVSLRKYKKAKNKENLLVDQLIFKYTEKPTAVFMVIPDYDTSNHIIGSIFISQLYTEMASNCKNTPSKKCFRRVHFILDEFGNMPAIDNMDGIMTVCLGRNILFDLAIQSYSQLETRYPQGWKTIKENCQNHILIMTGDKDSIEEISHKCGNKTVAEGSKRDKHLELEMDINLSSDGQRVITPERASQLIEGEQVIIRTLHRQDLKRGKVRPFPIFNTKETNMPYRYQFLAEEFDTSKDINDIDIECTHIDLSLLHNLIQFAPFIKDLSTRLDYSIRNSIPITIEDYEAFESLKPAEQNQFDLQAMAKLLPNMENLNEKDQLEREQLKNSIKDFKEQSSLLETNFNRVQSMGAMPEDIFKFFEDHLLRQEFYKTLVSINIATTNLDDLVRFLPNIEVCIKRLGHIVLERTDIPNVIVKNVLDISRVIQKIEKLLDQRKIDETRSA